MAEFNKNLEFQKKNAWQYMTAAQKEECFSFCESYKNFLNTCKTERESVETAIEMLRENGFVSLEELRSLNLTTSELAGKKLYYVHHGKCLFIAILGKNMSEIGLNIMGAHVDCPRLDMKPFPLSEKSGILYFRTHYYGGIKTYQWPTIPLALHGVVVKEDGTKVKFSVGESEGEPQFMISDLLPHLGRAQMNKSVNDYIDPENLNVIVGSVPGEADDNNPDDKPFTVKQEILTYLYDKFGITERELINAELCATPAAKAVDIGFDRGMIAGYGHDDRVCAYTELRAILDTSDIPNRTAVAYFSDKEEIGSIGITGARSNALEIFAMELCALYNPSDAMLSAKRCLVNSKMLSADVTAAFDPSFAEVYDESNAAFMGHGIAIQKYTGSGGKYSTSDASAEFVQEITSTFDNAGVFWQLNELGKITAGGGGTIAQYMADKGVEVIDCGVPLFNMHAPLEIASKCDIYWAYKAYMSFIK